MTTILIALNCALTILIILKGVPLMSHFGIAFDDLIASLNANTNAVAEKFDALHAELAAAAANGDPITQAQLDSLGVINAHLKALGADERLPVPPVPVVVPVPAPAPVETPPTV